MIESCGTQPVTAIIDTFRAMVPIESHLPKRRPKELRATDVDAGAMWGNLRARFFAIGCLVGLVLRCCAQAPVGSSPPKSEPESPAGPIYQLSRQDEDFSYLRDPSLRNDWWDPVKYVPLDRRGRAYLTLAGELRERLEYINQNEWGLQPQQQPYLLQRARLSQLWSHAPGLPKNRVPNVFRFSCAVPMVNGAFLREYPM